MNVYYFNNSEFYCPIDASTIKLKINKFLNIKPVLVRVSTREVQVFTPLILKYKYIKNIENLLKTPFIGISDLSPHNRKKYIDSILCYFSDFLNRERFWEAHEIAEELWRLGFPYGQLLAVTAGILAKAQEGVWKPVSNLLTRILPQIINSQAGIANRISISDLYEWASQVISCSRPNLDVHLIVSPSIISYKGK